MTPPPNGPVGRDSPIYVARRLVQEIRNALLEGKDVNLVGGWQTGKTTTLYALRDAGDTLGWASTYVDISEWGEDLDDARWYDLLGRQLLESILPERARGKCDATLRDHIDLRPFLLELVRSVDPARPVLIMLDEITGVPRSVQKSLFGAVRSIQNLRQDTGAPRELRAMNFVFAGRFDPDRLITQTNNSPFNIAQTFDTTSHDFDIDEIERIVRAFNLDVDPRLIAAWTSGHPYLTNALLEAMTIAASIDVAAGRLVQTNRHFTNLGRALSDSGGGAWDLAQKLAEGTVMPFIPGIDEGLDRLAAIGAVKSSADGYAVLRCKLYESFLRRGREIAEASTRAEGAHERIADRHADIAVVAALQEELDAVLVLVENWSEDTTAGQEQRTYFTWTTAEKRAVVAARALGTGPLRAAALVRDVMEAWRPRIVVLVGIAAGLRNAALGDIVAASSVVDFDPAKITPDGEQRRSRTFETEASILDKLLRHYPEDWSKRIAVRRPDGAIQLPRIHVGQLLSSSKVVASGDEVNRLLQIWPQAVGLEMESGGIATIIHEATNRPRFVVIKGVSDRADAQKNDEWHSYAAAASAAFVLMLLDVL